jgi:N-methylhydantoinase A
MIGVDVGGTFTDVVAVRNGKFEVTKVPTNVHTPHLAVIEGAARVGVEDMAMFNHASTHGLNAVITRRLPKIGFVTTEGHRDMLDAGRAMRPRSALTNAGWHRGFSDVGRPLVERYLRRGVRERIMADGSVLTELDEAGARAEAEFLKRCEVAGVAICTLNAYVNPAHEERLREIFEEVLGDRPVSISSAVSPLAKEYTRASTTVTDVFMRLLYDDYAKELEHGLGELGFRGELNFADCAATLMSREHALEQAYRIVFAGPAAGTVSCMRYGELTGQGDLICCDVGGTSSDISLVVDGRPFVSDTFELEHDLVINALSMEVSSVGAGGGSVVAISSSGDIRVGPESAGADPGPACYGRGGTAPTVTDACLLIGILDGEKFAGGEMKLDRGLSQDAFDALETPIPPGRRVGMAYHVAVNNIAEEITNVAIRHGIDPRGFTLLAYGAAGPMLLPAVLDLLRVERVVIPPAPGLFSALGLVSTDLVYSDSRSAYVELEPGAATQINTVFEEMEQGLRERIGPDAERAEVRRNFDARLVGQSWETPFVPVPDGVIGPETIGGLIEGFHAEYEKRTGQRFESLGVQGVTYRVELVLPTEKVAYPDPGSSEGTEPEPESTIQLDHLAAKSVEALVFQREKLRRGHEVAGPAVIREDLSTTLVHAGQVARIGEIGEIVIEIAPPTEEDRA